MKTGILAAIICSIFLATAGAAEDKPGSPADAEIERTISRLVGQLNDDRAVERDAAEKELLELAGANAAQSDRFLELLPRENDQMPLGVRDKLSRIRQQVEERSAKVSTANTTVTLSAKEMPLAEVFKQIEKQTGNRLIDNREQAEDDAAAKGPMITIELKDEPFWKAMDQILDQAKLGIYSYGGEDALSIVGRGPNDGPRFGPANYQGPFRLEVIDVQARRNLRQPDQKSLKLQLEVAWEPRLRPIALSQPVADLKATTDTGSVIAVNQPDAMLDVEVPTGTQAAEIVLPFELPGRDVKKIATLGGNLQALVPGRQAKFQFDDVSKSKGKSQRRGGVQVTVDEVRKNNAIWEVHMRLALDEDNDSLQSHRGWVFQNTSYLVGKDGKRLENAGFETTHQTRSEVGVAYLFDVPDGIEGLGWVYETPAAIVEMPVEYEIKDIELP